MSGVPRDAEQCEQPQPAPMDPEHPLSCSALCCRGSAGDRELWGLEGAMEEVGGDGFQPILKRKGRETKLETTFMSAMETLLTSSGSAFYNGTDAPRGTLGFFFEGLERPSAVQILSWFQEQLGCWGRTPSLRRPPVPPELQVSPVTSNWMRKAQPSVWVRVGPFFQV